MARMPRNQLLDELFRHFQERERWSIKVLRDRTQQPEAYLKEVLSEIADLNRSGEFNGTWELKPNFKGEGVRRIAALSPRVCGVWPVLTVSPIVLGQGRERPRSERPVSGRWYGRRRDQGRILR